MINFRFADPLALFLLIPAGIIGLLWLRGRWQQALPVLQYSDTSILGGLPLSQRVRLRRIPDVLRILAWLLLVIAIARPQSGTSQERLSGEGVDIVLTLDISNSMRAQDFPPTRLNAAVSISSEFVAGREFDRIGAVLFAQDAFYYVPPTLDYNLLLRRLSEVPLVVDQNISSRTAIGLGIGTAANMLRMSDSASRVIILLTDGSSNAGTTDPITASQAAATLGIRIYTIGLGTPLLVPQQGSLDEALLQEIATISNGQYFNALQIEDLRDIFNTIDRLETSEFERSVILEWNDQAGIFLLTALLCLTIERLLRWTVFQTVP